MARSVVTLPFSCSVETLWHVVTDLTDTAWRSDLVRVDVLSPRTFVEIPVRGHPTRFTITDSPPGRRWAFQMENDAFSGQWTGVFSAAAEGSCLQMTEIVQGKHWWMRPLVPWYLRRQQRQYARDLTRRLAQVSHR